jgi:hypothetical protein
MKSRKNNFKKNNFFKIILFKIKLESTWLTCETHDLVHRIEITL